MIKFKLLYVALMGLLMGPAALAQTALLEKNRTQSFDQGWKFVKANPAGAEAPGFDDAGWRALDLPHDWSIEDLPHQTKDSISGPFSKASLSKFHTGNTVGGTGWYRKRFSLPKAAAGKTAYLQFDGVYRDADVWVNGQHLGNHAYGYTSFYYDITRLLKPAGQPNVVAVQVKNEGISSRWYSGSGIYRHTWLTLTNAVHVAPWGVYVTTPEASPKKATVEVLTTVTNSGKKAAQVSCVVKLVSPAGAVVGKAQSAALVPAGKSTDLKQVVVLENPALWSLEKTNRYRAEVALVVDKQGVDQLSTAFGIRTIHFDAQTGFTLNGKTIKLKGGCIHHDNGPLGAAAIDRAEERKIELLKSAGFNALRSSHNPPSPALLAACDRVGMLVIDESFDMWERSKMKMMTSLFGPKVAADEVQDYARVFKDNWQQDVQSMLLRDRNHPSIIMWSIGNEIGEAASKNGLRIAQELVAEVKKYDRTRAITEGLVIDGSITPGGKESAENTAYFDVLDVAGYNYGYKKYAYDHANHPGRVMYASEFMPPLALPNWQAAESLPYVIGNFGWSAMDYIGEAGTGVPRLVNTTDTITSGPANLPLFFTVNSWPMYQNFQGNLDLIGNPKTASYYQHVVWRARPAAMVVHTPVPAGKREVTSPWGFPDELKSWNWPGHEGEKMLVHVYTRCPLVRLELNGKVVGEQAVDERTSITATFEVPYAPGTLVAHCLTNGVETATETIKTVGPPAAIRLMADRAAIRADRNDLSYVMVDILDAAGNVVPNADGIVVNFALRGNGELAGVGNGSPIDVSSFQQPRKKTWQGRCLAIVRPKGTAGQLVLTATAQGLTSATQTIVTSK